MKNNRVVVDLNKCQFARYFYRNQYGQTVSIKPSKPTVRAMCFDPDEMAFMSNMTLIEVAEAKRLLDEWTPEVIFQLQANHSLIYTGEKATSLWKTWCERQFNSKKSKNY